MQDEIVVDFQRRVVPVGPDHLSQDNLFLIQSITQIDRLDLEWFELRDLSDLMIESHPIRMTARDVMNPLGDIARCRHLFDWDCVDEDLVLG